MTFSTLFWVSLAVGAVQVETLKVYRPRCVLQNPFVYSVQIIPDHPYEFHGDTLVFLDTLQDTVLVIYQAWILEQGKENPVDTPHVRSTPEVPARKHTLYLQPPGEPKHELFRMRGFKSVGVVGGTRDVTELRQSMDLRLGGSFGGYQIEGIIHDRNLSLFGSERLGSLDQVYLHIQNSQLRARIGDLTLPISTSPIRARGFQLSYLWPPGIRLGAGYGVEQGNLQSVEFPGEMGKSGPYFLDPEGRPLHVVAGSEHVYVNGTLLRSQVDYTLDPINGTLTFSPRWTLGPDDQVRVEFQKADEFPTREVLYAQWSWPRYGLFTRFLQEGANLSLLSQILSQEETQALREIGDTTGRVTVDGGRYVGEGNGAYLLEDSVYVFVGENLGDYQVAFTFVGAGRGAYVYDPILGGYRFVGHGEGEYLPILRLDVPSLRRWIELTWRPLGRALLWRGGVLWAKRNIFASAPPLRRGWTEITGESKLSPTVSVEFNGLWKARGVTGILGDLLPPGVARTYGIAPPPKGSFITYSQMVVHWTPRPFFQLRPSLGRLQVGEETALRTAVNLEVQTRTIHQVWTFSRIAKAQGRQMRYAASWEFFPTAPIRPHTAIEGTFSDTLWYRRVAVGVDVGRIQTDLRWFQISHDPRAWVYGVSQGSIQDASWNARYQIQVSRSPEHTYGYQVKAQWQWERLTGQSRIADGTLPQTQIRFRYVGPGQGTYRYDSITGQYLPDPQGDYIRETVQPGAYTTGRIQEHRVSLEQKFGKFWVILHWTGRWRGIFERVVSQDLEWRWEHPWKPRFSFFWNQEHRGMYEAQYLRGTFEMRVRDEAPQTVLRMRVEQRRDALDEYVEPTMIQAQVETRISGKDPWGWMANLGLVRYQSQGLDRYRVFVEPSLGSVFWGVQTRGSIRWAYTWGSPIFPSAYQFMAERGSGVRYRLTAVRPLSKMLSLQVVITGRQTPEETRFYFQAMAQARF